MRWWQLSMGSISTSTTPWGWFLKRNATEHHLPVFDIILCSYQELPLNLPNVEIGISTLTGSVGEVTKSDGPLIGSVVVHI